ncbi:hypothetical protein D4R87_01980, partial [bacterium]
MSKNKNKTREYISLAKAAELCEYSQDYLSLRARSKKLHAKKLGRNWFTTVEWLGEYLTVNGRSLIVEEKRIDTNIEQMNTNHECDDIMAVVEKRVSDDDKLSEPGLSRISQISPDSHLRNNATVGEAGLQDDDATTVAVVATDDDEGGRHRYSSWHSKGASLHNTNKIKKDVLSGAEFLKKIRAPFSRKFAVGLVMALIVVNVGFAVAGGGQTSKHLNIQTFKQTTGKIITHLGSTVDNTKVAISNTVSSVKLITHNLERITHDGIVNTTSSVKDGLGEFVFVAKDGMMSFGETYKHLNILTSKQATDDDAGENMVSPLQATDNVFANIGNSVKNNFADFVFTFSDGIESFRNVPEDFAQVGKKISSPFVGGYNTIKLSANLFGQNIKTFKHSNIQTFKQTTDNVIASVGGRIKNEELRIKKQFQNISARWLITLRGEKSKVANAVNSVGDSLRGLVNDSKVAISNTGDSVKDNFRKIAFTISDGIGSFKNVPDDVVRNVEHITHNIKQTTDNLFASIANSVSDSSVLRSMLRNTRNIITDFAFIISDGMTSFKNVPSDFALAGKKIFNPVKNEINGMIEDVNKLRFAVKDGIESFKITYDAGVFNTPLQATGDAIANLGRTFQGTFRSTFATVSDGVANVPTTVKNFLSDSVKGLGEMYSDAKIVVANGVKSITGGITYLTHNTSDVGKSLVANTYGATASLWNSVKDTFCKTVDFVLSPWRDDDIKLVELDQKISDIEKSKEDILGMMEEDGRSLEDIISELESRNIQTSKHVNIQTDDGTTDDVVVNDDVVTGNEGGREGAPLQVTPTSTTTNLVYNALDESKLPLTGGTITGALNIEGLLTGQDLVLLGFANISGDTAVGGGLTVTGPTNLSTLSVASASIFEGNINAMGGLTAGSLSIDSGGNLLTQRIYSSNAPLHINALGASGDIILGAGRGLFLSAQQTVVDNNLDVLKGLDISGNDLTVSEDLVISSEGSADKITQNDDSVTAYIEGDVEVDGDLYADADTYLADNIKVGDGTPGSASLTTGSKSGYITGDFEIDGTFYAATVSTPYTDTITVAQAGGDYTTIQAAITACYGTDGTDGTCGTLSATNSILVRVMPGIYDEAVTMQSWIDVVSVGGYQNATITQADNASAVVTTADNARLEGFTISATGTPTATTVSTLTTSPNIFNNKITTTATDTYYCIDITTGSPHIEGNFIGNGIGSRGIRVSGTGSPYVSYNNFYNVTYDLANTGTGTLYSSYNTFRQSASTNIYVASGATIETDNDNYRIVSNTGILIDLTGVREFTVSGTDEVVGEVVYISGADTVDEANANSAATVPAIGIIIKKASATRALVKSSGIYYDSSAPYTAGATYYVSDVTTGTLTTSEPSSNAQVFGYAKSTTELLVMNAGTGSSGSSGSGIDYNNVITVSTVGGDYQSINEAVAACYGTDGTDGSCGTLSSTNGALVRVMPGTYTEAVTMREWIDVIASAGPTITIIKQTTDATIVTTADNSRLEGFTLSKTNDGANAIVAVTTTSPTLADLIVTGAGTTSQVAINITTGSPEIDNVEITTCNTAIQATTGSPVISNSTITGCTTGFYQNGDNSGTGTRISYTYIVTTGDDIITGASASTVFTDHNTLKGTGDNFHVAAGTTVESNNDERKTTNVNATGTFVDMTGTQSYTEAAESVAVGDAVYIDGSSQAAEAKADAENTMQAIGIVVKEVDATVFVKSSGIYYDAGVYGDFTIGSQYYVSAGTAGAITATIPAGEIVQSIGHAQSANELIIIVDNTQSGGSFDNVITVAKKNGDFSTIQAAIDACYGTDGTDGTCGTLSATNGAVIRVMPGSYLEAITMRAYIDVISTGGSDSTIITQTTASIITGASTCRLEGFTLSKTTDDATTIISVGATSGTYKDLVVAGAGVSNQVAFTITTGSP